MGDPEGDPDLMQDMGQDEPAGSPSAELLRQQGSRPSARVKSIGHYILMKTIGEGTFGKVKLGYHILTGERVAVKVLEKDRIVNVDDVGRVAREIHILKLIRQCRHIIQLYEIIETPHQLYLIMEYAEGGELFDYIVRHGRAEEREACRFLHQILAGVERVHEMYVCHRDLKPENLLLDDRKDIKIVDFGLSNTYQEGQLLQTACGSPCYAAPEMIAGQLYEPSMVDIWSCGVILFALVCGYLPFEDQNHTELYKKILSADYEMPNFVSKEVADLISGMLTTDPTQRMKLSDIRQHVWYCQIPEASLIDRQDDGHLCEEILEQLDSYGFPREYATKCLKTNKHNHVTTTYHLIREKRHRSKAEGSKASKAASRVIADLDATGQEDFCNIHVPNAMATGTQASAALSAVAAVATPSRGARGEADPPDSARRRSHANTARAAWVEGGDSGGLVWPGTSPASGGARAAAGSGEPDDPTRSTRGAVPRLNLGDLSQGAVHGAAGDRQGAHGHGGSTHRGGTSAVASRSPRGPRHSAYNQRGGCDARSVSPGHLLNALQQGRPGTSPRRPCSGEHLVAAATPRGAPHSARGPSYHGHDGGCGPGSAPTRRRTSVAGDPGPRRACSPWGRGGYGGWPDPVADLNMDIETSPWGRPGEAPLTARPRLQGNSGGCRERPMSAWSGGSGYRSGAGSGGRASSTRAPHSARSGHDLGSGEGYGGDGPGTLQVCCSPGQSPKHIMQEVLRSVAAHGISHRQASNFVVRCQSQGLRFQAELVQLDRSAGYALRLSRVAGDAWQFKDVCGRLMSEMDL